MSNVKRAGRSSVVKIMFYGYYRLDMDVCCQFDVVINYYDCTMTKKMLPI